MEQTQNQIKIKAEDIVLRGQYANMMIASHSPEEFTLDFIFIQGMAGQLSARIITSPGHLKRIIKALQVNLDNYEKEIGRKVEIAEEPKQNFGF